MYYYKYITFIFKKRINIEWLVSQIKEWMNECNECANKWNSNYTTTYRSKYARKNYNTFNEEPFKISPTGMISGPKKYQKLGSSDVIKHRLLFRPPQGMQFIITGRPLRITGR